MSVQIKNVNFLGEYELNFVLNNLIMRAEVPDISWQKFVMDIDNSCSVIIIACDFEVILVQIIPIFQHGIVFLA